MCITLQVATRILEVIIYNCAVYNLVSVAIVLVNRTRILLDKALLIVCLILCIPQSPGRSTAIPIRTATTTANIIITR